MATSMNAHDIMVVVEKCVNRAIDQGYLIFSRNILDYHIFVSDLMANTQIRHITTNAGLDNVRGMLSEERSRDFLLTLDGILHANIADRYMIYKALLENLSAMLSVRGFSVDVATNRDESNLLAREYMERIPSLQESTKLLENNKVLVSILCICIWGKLKYRLDYRSNTLRLIDPSGAVADVQEVKNG